MITLIHLLPPFLGGLLSGLFAKNRMRMTLEFFLQFMRITPDYVHAHNPNGKYDKNSEMTVKRL